MENEMSFVYIIKHGEYCKIGVSSNPNKRVKKIASVVMPHEFELLHMEKSNKPYALESLLHQKLEDKRINGEWFILTDWEIEYLIKNMGFYVFILEKSIANEEEQFETITCPIPSRAKYSLQKKAFKIKDRLQYQKDIMKIHQDYN